MIACALNRTAAVIWQLCDGEHTVADIIATLQEAYPEQAATMPREVDEALLALLGHGVIRLPRVDASAAAYDVALGGTIVRVEADDPEALRILAFVFAPMALATAVHPSTTFRLGEVTPGILAVYRDDVMVYRSRSKSTVVAIFLERILEYLMAVCRGGMLLHAAALARDGKALILAGKSGAGKTTLATWLTCHGFDYVSDELLCVDTQAMSLTGFGRPLHIKELGQALFAEVIARDGGSAVMESPIGVHLSPARLGARVESSARPCALVLPSYGAAARFDLRPLSKAQAVAQLMGCLVNAREQPQHGLPAVLDLVQTVPVFAMSYSDVDQAGPRLQAMLESF